MAATTRRRSSRASAGASRETVYVSRRAKADERARLRLLPDMEILETESEQNLARHTRAIYRKYQEDFLEEYTEVSIETMRDYFWKLEREMVDDMISSNLPPVKFDYFRKRLNALIRLYRKKNGRSFDDDPNCLVIRMKFKLLEVKMNKLSLVDSKRKAYEVIQASYSEKEFGQMLETCWAQSFIVDMPGSTTEERLKQMEEKFKTSHDHARVNRGGFLTTLLEFLIGDHTLIRNCTKSALKMEDFALLECPKMKRHKTPLNLITFIRTRDKTNGKGQLRLSGLLRCKDPNRCGVMAVGLYFFMRYQKGGPFYETYKDHGWLEEHVFKYGYDTSRKMIQQVVRDTGLDFGKVTHMFRVGGARAAELKGLTQADIFKAGGWNEDNMRKHYLLDIPFNFAHHAAGFELDEKYYIERDDYEPPLSLQEKLWPWIETYESAVDEADKERRLQDAKMLKILKFLRKTLLQDMAIVLSDKKDSFLNAAPVFKTEEFKAYQMGLIEYLKDHEQRKETIFTKETPLESIEELTGSLKALEYSFSSLKTDISSHADSQVTARVMERMKDAVLDRVQLNIRQTTRNNSKETLKRMEEIERRLINSDATMDRLRESIHSMTTVIASHQVTVGRTVDRYESLMTQQQVMIDRQARMVERLLRGDVRGVSGGVREGVSGGMREGVSGAVSEGVSGAVSGAVSLGDGEDEEPESRNRRMIRKAINHDVNGTGEAHLLAGQYEDLASDAAFDSDENDDPNDTLAYVTSGIPINRSRDNNTSSISGAFQSILAGLASTKPVAAPAKRVTVVSDTGRPFRVSDLEIEPVANDIGSFATEWFKGDNKRRIPPMKDLVQYPEWNKKYNKRVVRKKRIAKLLELVLSEFPFKEMVTRMKQYTSRKGLTSLTSLHNECGSTAADLEALSQKIIEFKQPTRDIFSTVLTRKRQKRAPDTTVANQPVETAQSGQSTSE